MSTAFFRSRARTLEPKTPDKSEPALRQVHRWPRWMAAANALGPPMAAMIGLWGIHLVLSSETTGKFGRITAGLMLVMVASALAASLVVAYLVLAREVRFLRDRVIVRQTWRREIHLPFNGYQREWLADLSSPHGVRLLYFRHNRGCIILSPPTWMRDALEEIRRIQQEEGWYGMED